jgi:RHS repeat-associated protein
VEHFTGKERDSETGLDYFGERYMSSAQGRFTSVDQGAWFLLNPQSYNGYSYALNNPLRYVDEEGESAVDRVKVAEQLTTLNIPYSQHNPQYPAPGNCGIDCAGLVRYVYGQDGITLPRTAGDQAATFEKSGTYETDVDKGQPGDAVFFADSSGRIVHTGIVVDVKDGQLRFVHAPRPGKNVEYAYPVSTRTGLFGRGTGAEHFVGYGRPTAPTQTSQNAAAPTTSMYARVMQWWNSWSLIPKREDVHSTIKYPKPKKPKKNNDGTNN